MDPPKPSKAGRTITVRVKFDTAMAKVHRDLESGANVALQMLADVTSGRIPPTARY